MNNKRCSRCGGTGKVTRGTVINGTCYKCGGDGQHRPGVYASRKGVRIIQWALVDGTGRELALNTVRSVLETLQPKLGGEIREKN